MSELSSPLATMAFFALFTERHQRAFELLSKTRVVRVHTQEAAS